MGSIQILFVEELVELLEESGSQPRQILLHFDNRLPHGDNILAVRKKKVKMLTRLNI